MIRLIGTYLLVVQADLDGTLIGTGNGKINTLKETIREIFNLFLKHV